MEGLIYRKNLIKNKANKVINDLEEDKNNLYERY